MMIIDGFTILAAALVACFALSVATYLHLVHRISWDMAMLAVTGTLTTISLIGVGVIVAVLP